MSAMGEKRRPGHFDLSQPMGIPARGYPDKPGIQGIDSSISRLTNEPYGGFRHENNSFRFRYQRSDCEQRFALDGVWHDPDRSAVFGHRWDGQLARRSRYSTATSGNVSRPLRGRGCRKCNGPQYRCACGSRRRSGNWETTLPARTAARVSFKLLHVL